MEKNIGNNMLLGANNTKRIIKLLHKNKEATKQDIVEQLNLSLPTVTQNLKKMIESGLVCESGKMESTGGRKPKLLSLNSKSKVSIGVEISKNHIRIVIIDLFANIIYRQKMIYAFENTNDYFKELNNYILKAFSYAPQGSEVLGVGISFPGTVEKDTLNVHFAPTLNILPTMSIKNIDIKRMIGQTPYKIKVINEAKAAGFAEVWGIDNVKNAVYLSITKGVGGAIIVDNRIFEGGNSHAGEFGHMTIVPGGQQCSCGKLGCLEAYCSTRVLGENSNMLESFFNSLKKGETSTVEKWDSYLTHLAIGINNILTIFDTDIVIGGDLASYLEPYMDNLKEKISKISSIEDKLTQIKQGKYYEYSSSVGSALLLVDEFLNG